VSRHLFWIVVQGLLFMPLVIGTLWDSEPLWVPGLLIGLGLAMWLGYAMANNLLRLFKARKSDASLGTVFAQGSVAGGFVLAGAVNLHGATNDVVSVDGERLIPSALAFGTLAVVLVGLATRDAVRIAKRKQPVAA
jgi:hypothetical protein